MLDRFVSFEVDFIKPSDELTKDAKKDAINADSLKQAEKILNKALEYVDVYSKIGITYSANHDQSMLIREKYSNFDSPDSTDSTVRNCKTGIEGSNQANVMKTMEALLYEEQRGTKYESLKNKVRILPISTCAHGRGTGRVANSWLREDLLYIEKFLSEDNSIVLGWQNQDANSTNTPEAPYAIGGGVSKNLTGNQSQAIQETLLDFSNKYGKNAAVNSSDDDITKKIDGRFPDPRKLTRREVIYACLMCATIIGAVVFFGYFYDSRHPAWGHE